MSTGNKLQFVLRVKKTWVFKKSCETVFYAQDWLKYNHGAKISYMVDVAMERGKFWKIVSVSKRF